MINAEKFKKEIRAMTDESTTFAFNADDPTVIRKCKERAKLELDEFGYKVFDTLVSNCPKLKELCKTWGDQHMLTIAMEENAELIQAISKIKRNGFKPINASHLDEEVADVLICICELFVMGYLDTLEIAGIIERKIERSMQRTQNHMKELEEEARSDGSF